MWRLTHVIGVYLQGPIMYSALTLWSASLTVYPGGITTETFLYQGW